MATLTNGNKDTTYELLLKNNLDKFITKTFSIDDVENAAAFLRSSLPNGNKVFWYKPENTLMVACHSWDLEGAKMLDYKLVNVKKNY